MSLQPYMHSFVTFFCPLGTPPLSREPGRVPGGLHLQHCVGAHRAEASSSDSCAALEVLASAAVVDSSWNRAAHGGLQLPIGGRQRVSLIPVLFLGSRIHPSSHILLSHCRESVSLGFAPTGPLTTRIFTQQAQHRSPWRSSSQWRWFTAP